MHVCWAMRLSCVALQRWSFMTDACESIHYLGFITVIELSLPCVRAELLGLKSCEVLNQNQPQPPLCLSYSKNAISSPNLYPSSPSPPLPHYCSAPRSLLVLALQPLEKCTPPEAALSNLSPKEVIKKPAVDPFPSLSPNPPVPREAQSPGMQRMDTCAQYRAESGLYSVTRGSTRLAQLHLSIFIKGGIWNMILIAVVK